MNKLKNAKKKEESQNAKAKSEADQNGPQMNGQSAVPVQPKEEIPVKSEPETPHAEEEMRLKSGANSIIFYIDGEIKTTVDVGPDGESEDSQHVTTTCVFTFDEKITKDGGTETCKRRLTFDIPLVAMDSVKIVDQIVMCGLLNREDRGRMFDVLNTEIESFRKSQEDTKKQAEIEDREDAVAKAEDAVAKAAVASTAAAAAEAAAAAAAEAAAEAGRSSSEPATVSVALE